MSETTDTTEAPESGGAMAEVAAAPAPLPAPAPEPAAPPSPAPAVEKTDWRERRIAQLTARLREAEAAAANKGESSTAPSTPPPASPDAVQRMAEQMVAAQRFNDRCNAAAEEGRKAFGEEFERRITALAKLVDPKDQTSVLAYNGFLELALETGEAPRVLHMLGGDLDEAARILALPPARQAMAMAKLATTPEVPLSNAPKPITPIGSRGTPHEQIDPTDPTRADGLSTRAWMERRERQLAERARA